MLSGVQLEQVEVTSSKITNPISSDKPVFGPKLSTNATDFDLNFEIDHLPFKLNMETDAKMTCAQWSQFLNLIYDYLDVFSLHDEDLGFCDKIKHNILATSEKPVYLPHCHHSPTTTGRSV